MSDLEVRLRTPELLPTEGLLVGSIPFKQDVIERAPVVLQNIGGEVLGVNLREDDIEWTYMFADDESRVFLDVCMVVQESDRG